MVIRSFAHKGIRRLFLGDDPGGVPAAAVDKLRKMLAFLQDMETADELHAVSIWKAHRLAGDRKGTWSLHVTRNWRLTFHAGGDEITHVNLEDYHRSGE